MFFYVLIVVRPTDATYINISVASTLQGLTDFGRRKFSSGAACFISLFRLDFLWTGIYTPEPLEELSDSEDSESEDKDDSATERWGSFTRVSWLCCGKFLCQICRHAIRRNLTVCCGSSGLQLRLPLWMWLLLPWRSMSDWGGYFLKPHMEVRIITGGLWLRFPMFYLVSYI